MDYLIIIVADDRYIKTLINFIETYTLDFSKLTIYNVGFNETNLNLIKSMNERYNFIFKQFCCDNYPEHTNPNIYNGLMCSYAFKPIIVYQEAILKENANKILILMDVANRFDINAINKILLSVKKNGIYSPISAYANTIESIELNHIKTVSYYGISRDEHINKLTSISSGLVAIDYNSKSGFEILNDWYKGSLNKDVILPEGSSRNNHRQDQTVLSILMYLYERNNNVIFDKENFGVSFWNKFDKSTIQDGNYPYKLVNKNTGQQLATIYCKDYNEAYDTYFIRKNISNEEFDKNYYIYL
jgi:hypothetical protein